MRHKDRHQPLKDDCAGLPLAVERKSIEPMAARLHPDRVQAAGQSMHHLVAMAPWSSEDLPAVARRDGLPRMQRQGPVAGWIIDATGIPKRGRRSVGVARQYRGRAGEQDPALAVEPESTLFQGLSGARLRNAHLLLRLHHGVPEI